jgi:hypothetical protein
VDESINKTKMSIIHRHCVNMIDSIFVRKSRPSAA